MDMKPGRVLFAALVISLLVSGGVIIVDRSTAPDGSRVDASRPSRSTPSRVRVTRDRVTPTERVRLPHPDFVPGRIAEGALSSTELRISGRVTDIEGDPVSGVRVDCFSTTVSPQDDGVETGVRGSDSGALGMWRSATERGRSRHTSTQTDGQGRFDVDAAVEGRVLLQLYAEGFRAARGDFGWLALSRDDVRFVLTRADPSETTTLTRDGVPLEGWEAMFCDVSIGDAQPNTGWIATDAAGRLPTAWLEIGHGYVPRFRVRDRDARRADPHGGYSIGRMVWNGQQTLDLGEMSAVDHGDFMRRWRGNRDARRMRHPARDAPPLE